MTASLLTLLESKGLYESFSSVEMPHLSCLSKMETDGFGKYSMKYAIYNAIEICDAVVFICFNDSTNILWSNLLFKASSLIRHDVCLCILLLYCLCEHGADNSQLCNVISKSFQSRLFKKWLYSYNLSTSQRNELRSENFALFLNCWLLLLYSFFYKGEYKNQLTSCLHAVQHTTLHVRIDYSDS